MATIDTRTPRLNLPVPVVTNALKDDCPRLVEAFTTLDGAVAGNIDNLREQWRRQLAEVGLTLVDGSFEEGATANSATDAVWHIAGGQCYTWGGALPKTVAAESTPDSTGGVADGAWAGVGDATLRSNLAEKDGLKLIGNCTSVAQLRTIEPTVSKQRVYISEHTPGTGIGSGYFYYDSLDTSSVDDDGVVIVTSGGKRWKRECTYISTDFYGLVPGTVIDMSIALNKALQAAKNSKYKRLVCTAGTFYVNSALKYPSNVTLAGSGNYASAIMALPTMPITENVIQNEKHVYQVFGTDYDENIHIENITIDANNRARNTSETWMDATQGTTILLSTVRNSSIKNAGYAVTCNTV